LRACGGRCTHLEASTISTPWILSHGIGCVNRKDKTFLLDAGEFFRYRLPMDITRKTTIPDMLTALNRIYTYQQIADFLGEEKVSCTAPSVRNWRFGRGPASNSAAHVLKAVTEVYDAQG